MNKTLLELAMIVFFSCVFLGLFLASDVRELVLRISAGVAAIALILDL